MKKTVPVFLFAVLVAVFGFQVRSADAYSTVTTCAGCHTFGGSGSTFHQGHLNLGLPNSCLTCHVQTGDTPATARCGVCHVAPGLPLHHVNANVGVNCVSCHPGTPAPENTPVPGYAGLTVALDPCNGSEERFNSLTISLDNDGDLLYDGADPDCGAVQQPDIAVTDSVAPAGDLQVPFGSVTVGASSDQTVTVTNAGTSNLVIGTVASANPLAAPFSIPAGTDGCSGMTLAPSANCTITVRFAPAATAAANDTFDIPSNDPDENPVTVTVSGTGVANNPPAASALFLPADGTTGLSTPVIFEWNRSTDPDGDTVTYDLFVCTDNTFVACPDPVNTTPITAAAATKKGLAFAASGVGMMFFGVVFAAGISRRRKVALLLALALTTGMLLIACSGDDETSTPRGQVSFTASGLAPATTYFWKVVATDGTDSTDSVTRSFTTR